MNSALVKVGFTATLSMAAALTTLLSKSAEANTSADLCGSNATAKIINGVVVCTVVEEKDVNADCKGQEHTLETRRIPLFYSDPTLITSVINRAKVACGSVVAPINSPPGLIVRALSKDFVKYESMVSKLDLPRERVNMEMWGIQISSADSAQLANVMDQINREIEHTRRAMHLSYVGLTNISREINVDKNSETMLEGFNFRDLVETGSSGRQRLSLPDVLARISYANYAGDAEGTASKDTQLNQIRTYNRGAITLCNFFTGKSKDRTGNVTWNEHGGDESIFARFNRFEGRQQQAYATNRILTGDTVPAYRRPFQRFQEIVLHQTFNNVNKGNKPRCDDGRLSEDINDARSKQALYTWFRRQQTLTGFLKAYDKSQQQSLDSSSLQFTKSASQLDGILGPITDALNEDIQAYFIMPTLHRIKQIVGRYRNVEYAEIGRTSVSGLNGNESYISSSTTSSFDEPTPLRLNNLIEDASKIQPGVDTLFPTLKNVPLGSANLINANSALALMAALSKEEVRWRTLSSGVELKIIPTVFRDRTTAQLDIDLTISEPASTYNSTDKNNPLRAPSRISKSVLRTKANINTMDLIGLSSFNNQTTVTGRRWYVPLVGPVWEGIFGDIPVVGNLFSPIRPPINIQHQSIMLANTLIVPTAIGLTERYRSKSSYLSTSINPTAEPCLDGDVFDRFRCDNGKWGER